MDQTIHPMVGARYHQDTCVFNVWTPFSSKAQLIIEGQNKPIDLDKGLHGYWHKGLKNIPPGTKYLFLLDGKLKRPDPASAFQPEGVHSWSETIDHQEYEWRDEAWSPPALGDLIIYELHVGTFTPEGTFEAIIDRLDHLLELGINAIEIMPIAQFPGDRNWGYDGVYPFAVQNSYGGVGKLKQLVDKCHQKNIAVILDVVYNHMGPEGNYLSDFGPYFTEKYHTPWGSALNFDDQYSEPVRNFFIQNALYWLADFHIDGLRLDAVHAIVDNGALHLLKEIRMKVDQLEKQTGKKFCLIAESDMNDVKIISDYEKGGYGLEGQWVDDFHHALHTLATGEKEGYYQEYGTIGQLAKSFKQGFIFDGVYSEYRKKRVGNSPIGISPGQFVVCIQNHDQVGNRMLGERLSRLVSPPMLKLAVGLLFISPFVPMLFMGEEYGEPNPFLYFVSHTDPDLVEAVQEGRKKEFGAFKWKGEVPDPQSVETFRRSKLQWDLLEKADNKRVYEYYKTLIGLRKQGAFKLFKNQQTASQEQGGLLILTAKDGSTGLLAALNFSQSSERFRVPEKFSWHKILVSTDRKWGGTDDAKETIAAGEELIVPATSLLIYKTV